jgi:methyl-accepting chemotaxis protein
MLSALRFKHRILLLVCATMAGLAIQSALSALSTRADILEGRQAALRSVVQTAVAVADGYRAAAAAGRLSDEAAKRAAVDAMRLMRFGGADGRGNYLYALTTTGVGVMHPTLKNWNENQPLIGTKNKDGVDIVKSLVDAMAAHRQGDLFLESMAPRPGDARPDAPYYPKLQYLAKVEGWNWIIGSGMYLDDVNEQILAAVARDQIGRAHV